MLLAVPLTANSSMPECQGFRQQCRVLVFCLFSIQILFLLSDSDCYLVDLLLSNSKCYTQLQCSYCANRPITVEPIMLGKTGRNRTPITFQHSKRVKSHAAMPPSLNPNDLAQSLPVHTSTQYTMHLKLTVNIATRSFSDRTRLTNHTR